MASVNMKPGASRLSTKELRDDTLPDFEKLLESHPAPGAYSCWCMYNHRSRPPNQSKEPHSRAKENAENQRQKKELVKKGQSHGMLVYADGGPVGWCQYGPEEELPRIENNPSYRKLPPQNREEKLWRITCFVVNKKYRRDGVARTALKAALTAIASEGGGQVEAYPIIRWGAYSDYRGTVSMFLKEGFKIVAPLGKNNVVMRRTI